MDVVPLETRGSIFDPKHANGILLGYEMGSDRQTPVVDVIRKADDGTIIRTRCTLEQAILALSQIKHG